MADRPPVPCSDDLAFVDDDELVARSRSWLLDHQMCERPENPHSRHHAEAANLIRDLRAALATRPGPDQRDAAIRSAVIELEALYRSNNIVGTVPRDRIRHVAEALAAVAGSAIPTEEDT
jgi:hypothetical protein